MIDKCPGSEGKTPRIYADDEFVRDFQQNDYDSEKILQKFL